MLAAMLQHPAMTASCAAAGALVCCLAIFLARPAVAQQPWGNLDILDVSVAPGTSGSANWHASESFSGVVLGTPVFLVRGASPGPTLCLTAGVHGDELNGVEIVRRVAESVSADPQALSGTLIGVPIVNLHGFRRSSRYLPDRRDLNRYFPGRERGSSASRIAYNFFDDVVQHCDFLVDLHTGSFHRTNVPHVRADLEVPATFELAKDFGTSIIVRSVGSAGTLRRAATEAGIPAITYESGEPMRFELADVDRGVKGIYNLMRAREMWPGRPGREKPEVMRRSHWVRCNDGGILISRVELGDRVTTGQILGTVTDPLSNEVAEVKAPHPGVVIGQAMNQVVMPGFAVFHLGITDTSKVAIPISDEDWAIEAVEETSREADESPEEE